MCLGTSSLLPSLRGLLVVDFLENSPDFFAFMIRLLAHHREVDGSKYLVHLSRLVRQGLTLVLFPSYSPIGSTKLSTLFNLDLVPLLSMNGLCGAHDSIIQRTGT